MINKFILISAILLFGIASVAGALYIRENVMQAYKIPAASMEPTLLVGDHILVDRSKASRAPRRGDLITTTNAAKETIGILQALKNLMPLSAWRSL